MFPNWSGWNFLKSTCDPRQKLFQETIDEHYRTLPDGPPRDFIDAYLQEVKKTEDPSLVFIKQLRVVKISVNQSYYTISAMLTLFRLCFREILSICDGRFIPCGLGYDFYNANLVTSS